MGRHRQRASWDDARPGRLQPTSALAGWIALVVLLAGAAGCYWLGWRRT